jgi:formylglycine-generating enzyme required for sulfatase activity
MSYAGGEGVQPDEVLPLEVWSHIFSHLPRVDTVAPAQVCQDFHSLIKHERRLRYKTDRKELIHEWPEFAQFDAQFVTIPKGFLPNDTNEIASFETGKYPAVTEKHWQEIMGSLPEGYQPTCPNCPITNVHWENEDGSPAEVQDFLSKLNEKTAHLGCTYDLPTDRQLQYLFRGDETGTNTAQFMMAKNQDGSPVDVNDNNRDDYIWHFGNSGAKIQPMGTKKVNAFGIERPSVLMMSKDIYDATRPNLGRSMRGGSWGYSASNAESQIRFHAYAGYRNVGMGFPLVRKCRYATHPPVVGKNVL